MLVDIDNIRMDNRIRKDFGDLKELADDIKQNGLINPPVVIPENDGVYTLLAGERRLRAMRLLGYQQVEVRTWKNLSDEEKLNIEISENEVRKDFSKAERIEYARRIERIEAEKARERMLAGVSADPVDNSPQGGEGKTRDIAAQKAGIGSGFQYEREKYIVDNHSSLTPEEFADWDEGKLSTNKAYLKIKSIKDQLESENKSLKEENQKLKSAPVTVREVDKTDYELVNRLRNEVDKLTKKLDEAIRMKNLYMQNAEIRKKDAEKYKQLKNEIDFLIQERSNIGRQIESATELAGLTVKLQHVLEDDLAPIKFKRCMEELDRSAVPMRNLASIIEMIKSWVEEMEHYLPATIVDSEVIEVE